MRFFPRGGPTAAAKIK
jgi:hypothetical protein